MIDISDSMRCNLFKNKRCCIFYGATIHVHLWLVSRVSECFDSIFSSFFKWKILRSFRMQSICNDYRRILYSNRIDTYIDCGENSTDNGKDNSRKKRWYVHTWFYVFFPPVIFENCFRCAVFHRLFFDQSTKQQRQPQHQYDCIKEIVTESKRPSVKYTKALWISCTLQREHTHLRTNIFNTDVFVAGVLFIRFFFFFFFS